MRPVDRNMGWRQAVAGFGGAAVALVFLVAGVLHAAPAFNALVRAGRALGDNLITDVLLLVVCTAAIVSPAAVWYVSAMLILRALNAR